MNLNPGQKIQIIIVSDTHFLKPKTKSISQFLSVHLCANASLVYVRVIYKYN